MLYLRQKRTADGMVLWIKSLSFCMLLGWGLPAHAQPDSEPVISERLREEAARPMRWIIESAKLDRERSRRAAAEAKAASRPRAAAPARQEVTEAIDTHPRATVTAIPQREPRHATAPLPDARSGLPAHTYTPNLPPAVMVAAIKPETPPPASQTLLVPISQKDPDIWRGMCPDGCDNYSYTVGFTVMEDGSVSNVRLVTSNFPRLKNAVLKAVSTWRYQPVAYAQNEEVTLRLAP